MGTLFLGLVSASKDGSETFFPKLFPDPFISKGKKQTDLHSAPEPLQCEDLKLTFSLEDVSWMQERRKSQLSQDIFKDLLSGSKIQTVLFTIHFQCSKP